VVRARLRPLLENYLFMRPPDQFPNNTTLGDMIAGIRGAPEGDPKAPAKALLDQLVAINDYSIGIHHRPRPGDEIDTNELRSFVSQSLNLVRGFTP